jgi:two-component system cell cycle sensor histidine kinase/response regulator CckA
MAIRFSDNLSDNTDGSDFIVRKRIPVPVQIILIFAVAFVAIYTTGCIISDTGGRVTFIVTLILTIGSLTWFTVYFSSRLRDLVLATEFQNAMLASAAQLSTRFCLITKRDGSIVYIDPGFQKAFPIFLQNTDRTIDGLLSGTGIAKEVIHKIILTLQQNLSDRVLLNFREGDGAAFQIMMTIDPLPRPKGYLLLRGRDYVEKRSSDTQRTVQSPGSVIAHALNALHEGILIADGSGTISYVNRALEEWLGFGPGEMLARPYNKTGHILYQYEGMDAGRLIGSDFEGDIVLQRKDRSLVTMEIRQSSLGTGAGLSAIIRPAGDAKKKAAELTVSGTQPAFSQFIASSPLAIARLDENGTVLECNHSLRGLIASTMPESGWPLADIVSPESRASVMALIEKVKRRQPIDRKPLEITLGTGEGLTASLYVSRAEGTPDIIAQLIDTSEQKNLEQRFAHSQKMQAVGQLAGGVAHDFNNLLTAMIGFCDLLLMRHPAGDQSFADIMQIKQNANRAANLVRQLLAFSRRQTLQPKMLDITDVLAELSNLVRRLIGENIELRMTHGRDLGMVKADQGQLEQVFINLAVNARDAMQKGGRLTIQTSHVTIDAKHPIPDDLIPPVEDEAIVEGDYVLVEMIDTGTGIPRELLQKIFEPFFSTKEVGSGTGLGLATVYGIIKQTGGFVYVKSVEGAGTTFSLFLKRYNAEDVKPAEMPESVAPPTNDDLTGKGTVLLVEDETPVRAFAARALRNKGYTVLEADCGEMAIEVMEKQGSEVDVIITDVIMPGINGPTMIEEVAPKFPRVKVVFISGYAEDVFVKSYGSEREFNFLPKPFTLKQLASKVKEVMAK